MDIETELVSIRDEYIKQVRKELLGPGSEYSLPDEEHELISSSPEKRYSIGILFPQENPINADNDASLKVEDTVKLDEEDIQEFESQVTDEEKSSKNNHIKGESEEDNLDEEIGLSTQNLPSSMGITFFADSDFKNCKVKLSFATYKKADATVCRVPFYPENPESYVVPEQLQGKVFFDKEEGCLKWISVLSGKEITKLKERDVFEGEEYGIIDALYKLAGQLKTGYVRVPHENIVVELDFSKEDYIDNNKEIAEENLKVTALKRKVAEKLFSITIMLVNSEKGNPKGTNCIFQPQIEISSNGNFFNFCEYKNLADNENLDDEEQSLELQYRDKKVYGTGLGVALDWDINQLGEGTIFSNYIPEIEVPNMDFVLPKSYEVPPNATSMKYLSDLVDDEKEKKIVALQSIVNAYGEWIETLEKKKTTLPSRYMEAAKINIDNCVKSCERMKYGIEVLQKDNLAWDAFLLANRAMFMQRVHLKFQVGLSDRERYPYDSEIESGLKKLDYYSQNDEHFWRPFQIAFLLMSIRSITQENCDERNLVDLIWFPTGGGKTEAYLGLTAFTIFHRRLAHLEKSSGTTVIMRYTLRLLAAQQFTRAATLICACEFIRNESYNKVSKYNKYELGQEIISIGLWIGSKHTPNDNANAKKNLESLTDRNKGELRIRKERFNKFQVLKCPWCGTKMTVDIQNGKEVGDWGYKLRNRKKFYLSCPQEACYFNAKLPIQIVDEELYETPPALLFGTVDKFAMLPWNDKIGNFFATENDSRPPELIIQDELHLISGPLGTMVGLYETAIDALCGEKGIKFKVVASTATIRRAKEQCSALYNREVAQFPAPGLDSNDSFFAKESEINYSKGKFGRKYIGIMPSGKTKAMMEVRALSALLQNVKSMNIKEELKDKLWTLTIYFNSLKDLGKCSTLIDDDVKDFIKRMAYRLGTGKDARMLGQADELTSRVSTTELNETLDKIEKLQYSEENIKNKRYASNTLLATNMISVGIDIERLNIMLLVGQPKLTSEYIQASSRVGRKYPGSVFTLYDGAKSRDRSHYEQFKAYHESFYKYVEPTGVTPFSRPARERALHALVITLLRHMSNDLLNENQASNFKKDKYREEILKIEKYIIERDFDITQRLNSISQDNGVEIAQEIEKFLGDWEELSSEFGADKLFYGNKFMFRNPDDDQRRVMKVFNSQRNDMTAKDTMTSMRNVDSMVAANVLVWEGKA